MTSLVNILLAVYNGETHLEEQLKSLLSQSYKNIAIFIRDNASTDTTPAILSTYEKKYPKKIFVTYGSENLGVIGNFSTLLAKAKAPYVMFCDADDVWMQDKVEVSMRQMKYSEREFGEKTPLLIHTDLHVVDRELKMLHHSFWNYVNLQGDRPLPFHRALVENCVTGCTLLMNRPLAEKVAPIPLMVPMHDSWCAVVAAAFGKIVAVPRPTLLYRQHGKNDSGANPYHPIALLKKFSDTALRAKTEERRQKRRLQAQEFYNRFAEILTERQKEIIQTYLRLSSLPRIKRFFSLYKNDLFETGFFRKLFQLKSSALKK